jgi:GTPase Era involved in 16S rRNA processing
MHPRCPDGQPRAGGRPQVKEQLFRRLSGELPYELEPVPTEARRLRNGDLLLKQTIFVRSDSVSCLC